MGLWSDEGHAGFASRRVARTFISLPLGRVDRQDRWRAALARCQGRKGSAMASEELQVVRELLRGIDLGAMTVPERRAASASVAQAPARTRIAPADASGVPAEWVTPAGAAGGRVIMYLHGGAYQLGSPATLRHLAAMLAAAAHGRAFSVDYRARSRASLPGSS